MDSNGLIVNNQTIADQASNIVNQISPLSDLFNALLKYLASIPSALLQLAQLNIFIIGVIALLVFLVKRVITDNFLGSLPFYLDWFISLVIVLSTLPLWAYYILPMVVK